MSKSNLGPTVLEFDGPSGTKNVSLTATTSTLTFEGASSANVNLTGINNVAVSNNIVFNDKQLTPNTKTITLAAPNVVTGSSYSLTLPPAQGSTGSYLKNNGSGSLSWDTIPITSFSYRFVRATANQTSIGSLVTFEGTSTGEGTLAFSSGVFTLTGGKTYYLQGTVDQVTASASFTFNYRWYDTTNSVYIGVGGSVINSSTSITSINDIAYGVVSPTSTINVQLQIVTSTNVTSINASATGGPAALVYEIITGTGTIGDVVGPASSTDLAIPRFSGTSGKILQDSSVLITNTNDIQGAATLQLKQSTNTITLTPTANTLTLTGNSGAKVALTGLLSATLATNLVLTETGAGVKTIAIRAPSAVTNTYTMTLPVAQGAASTVLTNDGTGVLTWAAASGGNITGPGSSTDKAMVRWNGTAGTAIQDSLVIVSDTGAMSGAISLALTGATSGILTIQPAATTTSYTVTMPAAQGTAGTYLKNDGTGVLTWGAVTGTGDVVGPSSAVNNAIVRFNTTTGKLIKNSDILISDTQDLSGVKTLSLTDATTNTVLIKPATTTTSYTLTLPATQSTSGKTSALYNDGTGALSWQANPVSFTGNTPLAYLIPVFADSTGNVIKRIIGNVSLTDASEIQNVYRLGFNKDNIYISASPTLTDVLTIGKTTDPNAYISIDGINNITFNGTLVFGIQAGFRGSAYPINFPANQGSLNNTLILSNPSTGQLSWAATVGGDVNGPSSSMDNALVRFDGTTGKVIQNSSVSLSDTADLTGVKTLGMSGSSAGVLTLQPAASVTDYTIKFPSGQGTAGQVMINDGSGNLTWGDRSNVSGIGVYGYYNSLGGWDASRRMNLDFNPVINTDVLQIFVTSNIIVLEVGTWEVTAVWQGTNSSGGSTIQWYNETTLTFVGNQCICPATNSVSTYNSGNVLVYSVTAPGGINLSIRETGSGTLQPSAGLSYVTIKKLNDTPFNPASTTEYLMGALTANVTTNLSAGDHIKFNSLLNNQSSNGTTSTGNITLDTTTAYTTTANVDSLGRITLKAGRTYELTGYAQAVADLTNATYTYAWYNANSNTAIGSIATYFPNQIVGTVTIGEIGTGTSGSVTVTGNILSATKSNGTIGQPASTIVVTYPNMGVVPNVSISLRDGGGSPTTLDNDINQPFISVITATTLTFWIEEVSGAAGQNIIAGLTISAPTTGGVRVNGPSKAIYRPLSDTRVELRIVSGAMSTNYASDTYAEVVTLIGDPNSNPFVGATASSAGSQGLVPTPAAGYQDRFLRGDATWANATSNSSGTSNDNALVRWDGTSGNYVQNSTATLSDTADLSGLATLSLAGSITGLATIKAASSTTSYTMTLPSAQGSLGTVLTNNGSGVLSWATSAAGNVFGPASSTTNAVATYTDTTGKTLSNSLVTISATGDISGGKTLSLSGSASGTLTVKPYSATTSYTLTFPPSQGTSGQILTNDGTGLLSWTTSGAGTGNVVGPTSATNNALARYDLATGKLIKDSLAILSDTADLTGLKTLGLSGATSGVLTLQPAAVTTSYSLTFPGAQGSSGTYLKNNGTGGLSWDLGTSGNLLNVQTFVSAAGTFTYTPTAGTKRALVYAIGGGGAGGGAANTATKSGGCGGTGGGCQVGLFVIDPTLTGTVVVGAGGTGVSAAAGNAGSSSTFTFSGSTITGTGGSGGTLATNTGLAFIVQPSIVGGTSTGINSVLLNTYTIYGSLGARGELYGVTNTLIAGAGGNSAFGGGANVGSAAGTSTGANGTAGTNGVGGGGSGAYQTNAVPFSGGAGGFGGVYVFEYTDIYGGAGGDVDGPISATSNAIARFSGTSGKLIQNSGLTISDTQDLVGAKTFGMAGATSGTFTMQPSSTTSSYTVTMPAAQGAANSYLKNDGTGALTWSSTVGGDVYGPSGATDNALARFDTSTGKLIQNSLVTISDTGLMDGVTQLNLVGSISGTMSILPAASTTSYSLTFPQSQGISGQVLQNDGLGNLSWVSQSSAGIAVYGYYNASGNWDASRRMNLNSTPVLNTSATQISVTGNIITLQAGTWELTGAWQGSASAGSSTFQWYNEGTSAFVGNSAVAVAANSTSTTSSGNILVYSFTSVSSSTFSIRDTGTGTIQPTAGNSYIYAKKLSDTPYNPAPTSEYLVGALTADVTTNLSTGDHIKFNTLLNSQSSNGTTNTGNISLDTTTAYTTTANVASLGRITLKAGRTYELTGYAQSVATLTNGTYTYAWYNADSNTSIGSTATYFPNQLTGTVLIGDVGGGTSGSVTVTGNILSATKSNGSIGASASTIVVTYPNMGVVPNASITIRDAGGSPSTNDNDIAIPVISTISATGLTFWIEESGSGTQNIIASLTISCPTTGGVRPNGPSKAIYAPSVDTRVELRIVSGAMSTNFASDSYAEVVMLIGAPNTLPFNGATASVSGTQGLVPQPTAGQQSRFLRGDATWAIVPSNSTGSSTDNAIVRWDGTAGASIQNSTVIISDTADITGVKTLSYSGATSGTLTIKPATTTTSYTLTWPSAQGVANSVLTNDSTGTLTWSAAYARTTGAVTDRSMVVYSGTTGSLIQSTPPTVSALGEIANVRSLTYSGSTSGLLTVTVPAAVTSYTITMPSAQGTANTTLVNNGAGLLSWQASSGISGPATSTDTAIVRWSGGTGKIIQDSGILISGANAMTGVRSLGLAGSTSGALTHAVPATVTSYTVTWPSAQGTASTVLTNDGSGTLSWAAAAGNVSGPASSTDNALTRFSLTTGKIIKNSTVLLSDAGGLTGVSTLALSGGTGSLVQQAGTMASSYTITWPTTQGSASTVLTNDGAGTLSWATGGNVSGPASSANTAIARYSGLTGKTIQNSGVTLSDTQDLAGVKTIAMDGTTSGTLTIKPAATTTSYTLIMPGTQGSASTYLQNNGSGTLTWGTAGNVTGPGLSTTNALPRYSDTAGQTIKNSVITVTDAGDLSGARSVALSGSVSGVLTINPAGTTTSYAVTMPPAQGAASTYLKNDGAGNLTWASAGTITGPVSSTNTALVRWSGTAGTALLDSGVTLSATQDLVGPKTIGLAGATTGTLTLKSAAVISDYTLTMPGGQGGASTTLINDGSGNLSWGAGGGGTDFMIGNLTLTVLTNLTVGNHAPFNQAYQSSNGTATTTNITLDTTSPYSTSTNTASLGRITLKANLTYTIMGIIKSLAGVDYYGYSWYNSDTNVRIGTRGEGFASTSQSSSISSNPSYCTLTPSVDTRIELRLTESSTGSIINWYSGSEGYGETMFSIMTGNAALASTSFTGATSLVSGTQGLVPAPVAGQQTSFLRGDATWATAGDVTGPASATDNSIARFDGTTGKLVQNSTVTISDVAVVAGVKTLSMTDSTTNTVSITPAAATTTYAMTLPAAQGSANTVLTNNGSGTLSWGGAFVGSTSVSAGTQGLVPAPVASRDMAELRGNSTWVNNNYTASGAPTVSNDTTQGYGPGSRWTNGTQFMNYQCVRSLTGQALWFPQPVLVYAIQALTCVSAASAGSSPNFLNLSFLTSTGGTTGFRASENTTINASFPNYSGGNAKYEYDPCGVRSGVADLNLVSVLGEGYYQITIQIDHPIDADDPVSNAGLQGGIGEFRTGICFYPSGTQTGISWGRRDTDTGVPDTAIYGAMVYIRSNGLRFMIQQSVADAEHFVTQISVVKYT